MTTMLFSKFQVGPIVLSNRIVVSPMCQYSADDGCANDWHLSHLTQMAMSGAGLVMLEATATERQGRITHGDLGLYSDANEAALARVLSAARRAQIPGTRWGLQIGHAGRKASAQRPWEGRGALEANEDPWTTEAPSAEAFMEGWPTPRELDDAAMSRVKGCFVAAAQRAARIGFDVVELHAAHGYLLHQFLSPLSNHRQDSYGGCLKNRMRYPLEIAQAVKQALPASVAFGLRITGTDWRPDGLQLPEAVAFACALKELGIDYVCVSSGGVAPARIDPAPGLQVPLAAEVRAKAGLATQAVGMIFDPQQAEAIVSSGHADMVALARAFLDDPRWVWHAAAQLGVADKLAYPPQYERGAPLLWKRPVWSPELTPDAV